MIKKLVHIFILLPGSIGFSQQLDVPYSDQISGIYSSDVTINLLHNTPGVTIFYTLNGNTPTTQDYIYTGPITLSNRNGDPNIYSNIPTNPSLTYPYGTYSTNRANDRGWLPPYNEVYKINVIRFRAFKAGYAPSETITQTFMIDPLGADKYELPVLSIVVDSVDFFSNETGIMVYGNQPDGNYYEDWERILHFELFDENGNLALQKQVRARNHGGGSRSSCKKNLRLYGEYLDEENFNYPFFENYTLDKFKRLILRSGGHSPTCFPRDDLANSITEDLKIDQQHNKHIILFINGEYWGIYTIKERVDNYFFQNRNGVDDNDITILDQEYDIQGGGHQVDSDEMVSLEQYIVSNDMTIESNYHYVLEKIDVDNYIDYMCSEIFLSNEDWVYSNVVLWRKTGPFNPNKPAPHDGRFRWAFYDFDGAFGGDCNQAYYTVNTLNAATVASGLYSSYTRVFRGLLDNLTFRKKFINRMCDLLNSHFKSNRLKEKIEALYNKITPSMLENVQRWRYPSTATTLYTRQSEIPSLTKWNLSFYNLNVFAERRQRKIRDHIMLKWSYPDSSNLQVNVNDADMGMVQVNTILLNEQLPGVNTDAVYPWDGYYINTIELPITAIAKPGYRFSHWLETGSTNQTEIWTPNGDTIFTAIFEIESSYQPIVINEIMASNSNYYADNFDEYDDWLELFNPNNYEVDISQMQFEWGTNSFIIPAQTKISANGYLIFWFDNENYQGFNHTNGKLPNIVSSVKLKDENGNVIDDFTYPSTNTNYSYGRFPNGSNSFIVFDSPTPNQNNNTITLTENANLNLKIYPNPTADKISLSAERDFVIVDLSGKIVDQYENCSQTNLSHLPKGTYILITEYYEKIKIVIQ